MNPRTSDATGMTYDKKTRCLHWTSAFLIIGLWIAGEFLDVFPRGTARISVRSTHIFVGLLLGVLLVMRVNWRRNGGTALPPPNVGTLAKLMNAAHYFLYVLIALMVVSGIALVWIRGDSLFNWWTVPAFDPGNKALRHDAKELHGWFANTLLTLGVLHAAVALWHQWVLKDNLLRRMWPQRNYASGTRADPTL